METVLSPNKNPSQAILEALNRLPSEALPELLNFMEYLEYKFLDFASDDSEDEALWDAVQASEAYRKQHPDEELERYSSGAEFLAAVADL